jgi:competence protein ComEC
MPGYSSIPVWKTAPLLRAILPLVAGILLQWYVQIPSIAIVAAGSCFCIAYLLLYLLPLSLRYLLRILQGAFLNFIIIAVGAWLTWNSDPRQATNWYGNIYTDSSALVVTLQEPLVTKANSYKAECTVDAIITNAVAKACTGKLLLYFSKDSATRQLQYGDKIIINKKLQLIKNSGNPGAFNYQRYAAFQQLFHHAFLKQADWIQLQGNNSNRFQSFLFTTRDKILATLRHNITQSKDELGIAEALLIGYTQDLDKDLVQAYSNTGVVHIIAISGMHLALIYVLLAWVFARLPFVKSSKWLQVILMLGCLWLFSLLTGASASVLRAAVMFSFIAVGKTFFEKTASVYNALAASALLLLCYNPYYLWDVGFQLSYLAVTGIVIFQKPIYNLLYIKNKWADKVWELMAVSLAAQLLTFPVCIYYFHQFPNLFWLTNVIAVPLSGLILYVCIALVALSWVPLVGQWLGQLAGGLLWVMNKIVLFINNFSFAVWDGIYASTITTWLLYITVITLCAWFMNKNKKLLKTGLAALLLFIALHTYSNWQIKEQQKLVVYNVPRKQAIDIIQGNSYRFIGDSTLLANGMLQNFHLKPGRIAMQLTQRIDSLPGSYVNTPFYICGTKKIMVLDKAFTITKTQLPVAVDVIILCKNVKANIAELASAFSCTQYVADASNSLWKIDNWKQDCYQLHLRFHSIPEQGAYVLDL